LTVASGRDTLWYAPGVGVIKARRHAEYRLNLIDLTTIDSQEFALQWYVGQ
jgi:hypothetical protein